jgi:hypothetical protein
MVPTNPPEASEGEAPEPVAAKPAGEKPGEVVSLDSFRKK